MPENHRILYFSTQFPNQRSPRMGVFSLQRVLALRRAGYEVQVVSPLMMNPPPRLISRPGQAYHWIKRQAALPFEMPLLGISAYYPHWICPPNKIFGWTIGHFLYLQVRKTVLKIAKSFRPDVILSSWLPDGVAASKLGKEMDIPVLAIADGSDVNVFPDIYPGWKSARNILNDQVSMVIYVSEALQAVARSKGLYGKNATVLHNAVDIHLFTPGAISNNGDPFTILSVGRLIPMKGFQILLDAVSQLNRGLAKPVKLILVGDGPQRGALLRQTAFLGIRDSVELVAPMPHEKLVQVYQQANIFCLPSFSEGLPCVVIEAMACGKPVVASNIGGVPEVVDTQSGILVAPGDAGALCGALLQAMNSEWDGELIRKKIAEKFSWEKWTESMRLLLDTVSA